MLLELFRFDSLWLTIESYSREKALARDVCHIAGRRHNLQIRKPL